MDFSFSPSGSGSRVVVNCIADFTMQGCRQITQLSMLISPGKETSQPFNQLLIRFLQTMGIGFVFISRPASTGKFRLSVFILALYIFSPGAKRRTMH